MLWYYFVNNWFIILCYVNQPYQWTTHAMPWDCNLFLWGGTISFFGQVGSQHKSHISCNLSPNFPNAHFAFNVFPWFHINLTSSTFHLQVDVPPQSSSIFSSSIFSPPNWCWGLWCFHHPMWNSGWPLSGDLMAKSTVSLVIFFHHLNSIFSRLSHYYKLCTKTSWFSENHQISPLSSPDSP